MTPSEQNDTTAVQEPRHTPGPWRYEADFGEVQGGADNQTAVALVVDASDRYSGGLDRPAYDEAAANARLIAAAPDLLEALKEYVEAFHESPLCEGAACKTCALATKARAAITRAEAPR